jgi:DNA-binding transcriptional LysR family regulator
MVTELGGINLNRLVVFVAVVEAGSLTAAGRKLNLAKTQVSAHIRRLEAEVGASLLIRSTRRISLTHAGELFFESMRRIVRDVEEAVSVASQDAQEPRGILKVTAPVDFGAMLVAPVAAELSSRYPDLKIDLITADRVLDLVEGGIDVAIRAGRLADSSYKAVRIGSFSEWLVASPSLLSRRPLPDNPDGLAGSPFVALSVLPHPLSWTFEGPDETKRSMRWDAVITANTALAVREVALAGGGFAILPDFAVAECVANGQLTRVFPDWKLPEGGIYAVFSAARQPRRKVRVFIDGLREHLDRAWGPKR